MKERKILERRPLKKKALRWETMTMTMTMTKTTVRAAQRIRKRTGKLH